MLLDINLIWFDCIAHQTLCGGGGLFYSFKWFLPAFAVLRGRGREGSAPCAWKAHINSTLSYFGSFLPSLTLWSGSILECSVKCWLENHSLLQKLPGSETFLTVTRRIRKAFLAPTVRFPFTWRKAPIEFVLFFFFSCNISSIFFQASFSEQCYYTFGDIATAMAACNLRYVLSFLAHKKSRFI